MARNEILGASVTLTPVAGRVEAQSILRLKRDESRPWTVSFDLQAVNGVGDPMARAQLRYGTDGHMTETAIDVARGTTMQVVASMLEVVVSVPDLNDYPSAGPTKIGATAGEGGRPSSTPVYLSARSVELAAGVDEVYQLPPKAALVRVVRTNVATTAVRAELENAAVTLGGVAAAAGENLPGLPVPTGALQVRITNDGPGVTRVQPIFEIGL